MKNTTNLHGCRKKDSRTSLFNFFLNIKSFLYYLVDCPQIPLKNIF
jgi:hypothetical protein